jgi:DNA-binding winged helix-turn-helix (wHTH) protein/tetratricopeptide (TPR) repeat protein
MKAKLGELVVDENAGTISRSGARLAVGQKVVELLVQLGHAAGRPVRRERLVRDLWPERTVSDKALSMLVVEARRQLAPHFAGQEAIRTVPGVGYSLAIPYEPFESPSLPARNAGKAYARMGIRVAAPQLLSAGAAELGACLRDTLLNTLGSEPTIEVRAREIASVDELGDVTFVIHSSVRVIGRAVVLSVRCVTAREESICWAATERAPLSKAFDAETRLCERLRQELTLSTAGYCGRQTWRQYRQSSGFSALADGQRLAAARNTPALSAARGKFREALALDPGCAPALVGMADCEILAAWYDGTDVAPAADRAAAYVERAMALNSDLAAAHCTRGFISLAQLRFASAEHELLEAIRLDDSNATALQWYADFLASQGCMADAVQVGYLAVARAPQSALVNSQLGQLLHMAGRFEEAQAQLERVLAMNPACAGAHCFIALNLAMKGDEAAVRYGRRAVELSPNTPFYRGAYGSILGRLGERDKALQQLHSLEAAAARAQPFAEAAMMVATTLGQIKRGIDWFRVATAHSAAWALYAAALPILMPIHAEPSFKALLRGRGLALTGS